MNDTATPTPSIPLTPVTSSQVAAIGHDPDSNTMAVRFHGKGGPGSLYHYRGVDAQQFAAFKGADSIGSHFIKHFKSATDRHPYTRINEDQPAE